MKYAIFYYLIGLVNLLLIFVDELGFLNAFAVVWCFAVGTIIFIEIKRP